jgi:hypothetical protein
MIVVSASRRILVALVEGVLRRGGPVGQAGPAGLQAPVGECGRVSKAVLEASVALSIR